MTGPWTIGSHVSCARVVKHLSVAEYHCRLSLAEDGFYVEDLGTAGGTFVNGERISARTRVTRGDSIVIGDAVVMPWPLDAIRPGSKVLTIGRLADNDFVVDLPVVSGRHARLIWEEQSQQAFIEDLNSSNGTSLGAVGSPITHAILSPTDTVYLGRHAIPASQLFARLNSAGSIPTVSMAAGVRQLVLGRDPSCDQVLNVQAVSGRHARIYRERGALLIEDLGSSNGTFVNGCPVAPGVPAHVRAGDKITLGSYDFTLADGVPVDALVPTLISTAASIPSLMKTEPTLIASPILPAPPTVVKPMAWRLLALLIHAPILTALIVALSGSSAATLAGLGLAALWFGITDAFFGLPRYDEAKEANPLTDALFQKSLPILAGHCVLQCALAYLVVRVGEGPNLPGLPALVLLVIASLIGLALGMGIIASWPTPITARAGIAAGLMLALWVLGGHIWPIPNMPAPIRAVSDLAPSRWAFEGLLLMSANPPVVEPDKATVSPDIAEPFFPTETVRMGVRADGMALVAMFVGLLGALGFIWIVRARQMSVSTG